MKKTALFCLIFLGATSPLSAHNGAKQRECNRMLERYLIWQDQYDIEQDQAKRAYIARDMALLRETYKRMCTEDPDITTSELN